ncbi:MAG: response regulator [Candidatus Aminicenantes bacterium]|jgi:YesN/AraC family two-component response regulator
MEDSRFYFRVLVVEDEILIRKYVVLLLESVGCTIVGETGYGKKAIPLAREKLPELILMDIRLKGDMDGIEAAKQISSHSNAAILFMSAYDYQKKVEAQHISNTLGYLKKPVEDYELGHYLKRLAEMTAAPNKI